MINFANSSLRKKVPFGDLVVKGLDFIAPVSWEFGVRIPFYTWKEGKYSFNP